MMWTFKGVLKPLPPRQPHILAAWLFLHRCLVPVPGWAAPGAPGNNEQRPISHNLSAAAARWLRLSLGAHTPCQRCPDVLTGKWGGIFSNIRDPYRLWTGLHKSVKLSLDPITPSAGRGAGWVRGSMSAVAPAQAAAPVASAGTLHRSPDSALSAQTRHANTPRQHPHHSRG